MRGLLRMTSTFSLLSFLLLGTTSVSAFGTTDAASSMKACEAGGQKLGAPTQDRYGVLRIDSELTLLALNSAKQPAAGLALARSLVTEIQGIPNRQLRSVLSGRLARVYITLNRSEAEDWLAGLPSREKEHMYDDYKARVYSAAAAAFDKSPKLQMEFVGRGLASGAFQISEVLTLLQTQGPSDGAALFHQAVAAFPTQSPTDQDVRYFIQLTRTMAVTSREDASKAVGLMLAALEDPNLQWPPEKERPKLIPARILRDRNTSLRTQVDGLAAMLGVKDNDAGGAIRTLSQMSLEVSQLPGGGTDDHSSAELQSAIRALQSTSSSSEIMRLGNTISDKGERAQFYSLVVQKFLGRAASIDQLAEPILDAVDGSDTPELALSVPQTVFQAALLVRDTGTAEWAARSLEQGAARLCKDSMIDEGDTGYARGSACIAEYQRAAVELAKSPIRQTLHISDPSLLQRLQIEGGCESAP
jgi:hypothetical protein